MKMRMRLFFLLSLLSFLYPINAQDITGFPRINPDSTENPQPWSHLNFNDNPDHFQFAIIPDNTGGTRQGIMEDAIRKLNILQPEFVISIGDMVEGYTTNETEIYKQWSVFKGFIKDLKMPFFYVPGNHDYTNPVMSRIWQELFGPSYYHFIYKDVLFICLNTIESAKGTEQFSIEEPQFNYVSKTLSDYPDVRWTFIIMHYPLWLYENTGYWDEIELILQDRKHTVFAGHNHKYVKYERNNGKYFTLATAGGISQLRGPDFGEFDHIALVSMTVEGPVVANLFLQGIWDENVFTEELNEMTSSQNIIIEPVYIEEDIFTAAEFKIEITNAYNYPMWTYLTFDENPLLKPEILSYQNEIAANSSEILTIPVNAISPSEINRIQPLNINAWSIYKYENNREIQVDSKYAIVPVKKEYCYFSNGKIWVDGVLDEWEGFSYKVDSRSPKTGDLTEYFGDYDGSYEFDIRYDLENLYIALSVWDDQVILDEEKSLWNQDVVRVYLDARPIQFSSNGRGEHQFDDFLFISLAPAATKKADVNIYQKERLPQRTLIATKNTVAGFDVEIAIPIDYIELKNNADWESFRINFSFVDFDENNTRTNIWWKPEWDSEGNYIGSGVFFRKQE